MSQDGIVNGTNLLKYQCNNLDIINFSKIKLNIHAPQYIFRAISAIWRGDNRNNFIQLVMSCLSRSRSKLFLSIVIKPPGGAVCKKDFGVAFHSRTVSQDRCLRQVRPKLTVRHCTTC